MSVVKAMVSAINTIVTIITIIITINTIIILASEHIHSIFYHHQHHHLTNITIRLQGHTGALMVAVMILMLWLYSAYRSLHLIKLISAKTLQRNQI